MVSTRCLCFAVCLALASSCGPTRGGEAVADDSSSTAHALGGTRLRLMAGNLTTGQKTNNQSYNLGEGIRIFGGTHADVAMVQELNYFSSSDIELRSFVDQAFGPGFSFVRGAQSGIPNGVVSRYPIISQGNWVDPYVGNRAFTWAQIDVPGPRDLWVVSVHFLTANPVMRQLEAAALVASAQAQVPASDYLAIGWPQARGWWSSAVRPRPARWG